MSDVWSELRVRVVGDERAGGLVVVLLHGLGANGDDLVPLARSLDAPAGTRFLFPEAPWPHPEVPGGKAWWDLDILRRQERLARGEDDVVRREVPRGLDRARSKVLELLDAIEARLGVGGARIVLGGYSQGATLAADVALQSDRALGGVVLLSPTIVSEDEWTRGLARRRGVRFFVSHGRSDEVLPFGFSERLRANLESAGARVTWVPFDGGHEIPPPVEHALGLFLADVSTQD